MVVAAITSCTNTSNPEVMVAAGLLARGPWPGASAAKPWVKTSLAPGSRVVMDYLDRAGLTEPLASWASTWSASAAPPASATRARCCRACPRRCARPTSRWPPVLSGNRNFEGRIHPDVRMNYLASPPLVVAYALAGTMDIDLTTEPLGTGSDGRPVHLPTSGPPPTEVTAAIRSSLDSEMFRQRYGAVFDGDERWRAVTDRHGRHLRLGPAARPTCSGPPSSKV